jgi:hypothetical protein
MAPDQVTWQLTWRADGRWSGNLTSRPLPEDDSSDLTPDERAVLAEVWIDRAASERRVADAFAVVHDALDALGADPALRELALRAVDDEMRHAELSRRVASIHAGRPLSPPPLLPLSVPSHRGADERLRRILHVVGQCAFNETIASAFLESALAKARAPLALAALRELLSDEIDHARIGWALLASLDERTRRAVEAWLPSMAIANLRMWRDAPRRYPDSPKLAEHGAPPRADVEEALLMALRDLVIPGFDALEMQIAPMREWLARGAPT